MYRIIKLNTNPPRYFHYIPMNEKRKIKETSKNSKVV